MQHEELRKAVLDWADERNLLNQDNAAKQLIKLTEEVGELANAFLKNKPIDQMDAIGDIQVVLIILARQLGIPYEESLLHAYNTIKDRKGKTINGTFIKDEQ